jgi:hypothetical protein
MVAAEVHGTVPRTPQNVILNGSIFSLSTRSTVSAAGANPAALLMAPM